MQNDEKSHNAMNVKQELYYLPNGLTSTIIENDNHENGKKIT